MTQGVCTMCWGAHVAVQSGFGAEGAGVRVWNRGSQSQGLKWRRRREQGAVCVGSERSSHCFSLPLWQVHWAISFWRRKWAAFSYHPSMVAWMVSIPWIHCMTHVRILVLKYEIRVAASLISSYLAWMTFSLNLLIYSWSYSPELI